MMRALLQQACDRNEIRLLDLHTGLFLEKLAGGNQPELLLAATLASTAVGSGHTCLPLDWAAELSPQLNPSLLPDPPSWREILLTTPVVGRPGTPAPLILDNSNRLFLYRFYRYEETIAQDLLSRAETGITVDRLRAGKLLKALFPEPGKTDDQKSAAKLALSRQLLLISGGPGTGKTHTIARILALLQALHSKPLHIGLAAPTGKAATRLQQAIGRAKQSIPAQLAANIPEQAQTLHRLLGFRPGADEFRFNRNNPLQLDLLVLDEASMIDVVLMTALLQALPAKTRLILLGDRNQLASVEAGSVFADLCNAGTAERTGQRGEQNTPAAPLAKSVITLRTSYRFQGTSGIGALATAINSGSLQQVNKVAATKFPDLDIQYLTGTEQQQWLRGQISRGFQEMFKAPSVTEALRAMEKFRVLCAVRKGPAGVEAINALAEQVLHRDGLIPEDTDWYRGKPIIIRRNQYDLELFNGDTGLLWPDRDNRLRAWFIRPDNQLYPVSPARLPDHNTAYGITIHKAQGSEFDQVLLLLPEEQSRVLSRELLYTGITRARSRLSLCCSRNILAAAVRQRTIRSSGLVEKLRQHLPFSPPMIQNQFKHSKDDLTHRANI